VTLCESLREISDLVAGLFGSNNEATRYLLALEIQPIEILI